MLKCLQIICAKYYEPRYMFYFKNCTSSKFAMLLNRPVPRPPLSLVKAVVDETISIVPPTLPGVYVAIKKIKSGKSPGVCGVYPEYLHYAGPEAMRLLVELFAQVWESEIVPNDWR